MSLAYRLQVNLKALLDDHKDAAGRSISQTTVAAGAKVPQTSLNRLLRGVTTKTDWELLDNLARYLQIDPQQFFRPLEIPMLANAKELHELNRVCEDLSPYIVQSVVQVAKTLATAQQAGFADEAQSKPVHRSSIAGEATSSSQRQPRHV